MYRILHVINTLDHGGAEHQLLLNISAMDSKSYVNYVCCVCEEGALASEMTALGVPVFCLGVKGKPQWPKAVLELRRLIKKLQIDLVHTNLYEGDIIGGLAAKLAGVPVVGTLVNIAYQKEWLIDNPNLNRIKLVLTKGLLCRIYGICHNRFIAISQCVRASAIKDLGISEEQISVIYRALPTAWLETDSPETLNGLVDQLGVGRAHPLLLNVGRLMPQKGQKYLLEAMPRVLAEFPEAKLLIAGDGFLRGELIQLRDRLGITDQVIFLGTRSDIKQLMQISDIFCFPSLFEGLGVSLLEAMGVGKPCITSAVGPLPEVVEDEVSGLLTLPQSPDALAEAILRLARDPQLMQEMGRRGRQIATEKFAVSSAVVRLDSLYREVLRDRSGLVKQTLPFGSGRR